MAKTSPEPHRSRLDVTSAIRARRWGRRVLEALQIAYRRAQEIWRPRVEQLVSGRGSRFDGGAVIMQR